MRHTPRSLLSVLAVLAAFAAALAPGTWPVDAVAQSISPVPAKKPARQTLSQTLGQFPSVQPGLPVALIADTVDYDSQSGQVVASGGVEVFYGDRTLTADKIVYDSRTGRISAEGEIVLRDPSGATVYADVADLDAQLRDGLVRGARSVMGENIRLSAVEARRIDARFNALSKAVYSPCKVCADDPTPLWRIRARRVIHDEQEKVIYYEDATLDVLGVPVMWLPYFSHPDPTVGRATGFLVPEIRQSSVYGWGLHAPYYWVLDDYSDVTFDPFLTTNGGLVLGGEYRRAVSNGSFSIGGSATRNDYAGKEQFHGHLESKGSFDLANGYRWGFDGEITTDTGYLRRYDFSDEDRLTSELYLRRYQPQGYFDLTAVYFQSLRDNEPSGTIPAAVPAFDFRRDFPESALGGDLGFFASSEVLIRGRGRDASRISIGADWDRQRVLSSGLVLRGFASVRGDLFVIDDFSGVSTATEPRLAPLAGIEARFPLISDETGGVSHVLEPIVQAIAAPYGGNGHGIANEDSLVNEFDETNLFDLSHFSGIDGFEEGPRLNLGLRYERVATDGLRLDASVGRVLRLRAADEFSPGSGLSGTTSDWVGAWAVGFDPYVTVRQRMRIEDDLTVTRNEFSADLSLGRVGLSAGYTFLAADPTIEVPDDREEVSGRASLALDSNWTLSGQARRDIKQRQFVEIGGGLAYVNECCEIDLFVKKRFTESDDAPASTSVGVQVRLFTLGSQPAASE